MNNIKIAKQLIKLAKSLIAEIPKSEHFENIYNEQIIDNNKLYELYDKYTDEISNDLQAGVRQHLKTITIKSLKRWLKDNNCEDWASGKKYDALYDYNKGKFNQSKFEIKQEIGDTYLISPQQLYKSAEEKNKIKNSEMKSFKSNFPTEQKLIQIYNSKQEKSK